MNKPPFAPSQHPDDQPQRFKGCLWYLNPALASGVGVSEGIIDNFTCQPSYISISWADGTLVTVPRERVVRLWIEPLVD